MSVASLLHDTALHSDEFGVYSRDIPTAWSGTSGVVGGYSLALVAAAVNSFVGAHEEPTGNQRLVSLSTQFLRPVAPGLVHIEVGQIRVGRSTSFWHVELRSGDRVALQATAVSCQALSDASFIATAAPVMQQPDRDEQPWEPAIGLAAHDQFWFWPRSADGVQAGGWIRPRGDFPTDARLLAMVSDIWPPPVLSHLDRPATVVGLTHSLHVHAPDWQGKPPPDSPLLITLSTQIAAGGTVDETVRIWSASGVPVATGHQVRLLIPLD